LVVDVVEAVEAYFNTLGTRTLAVKPEEKARQQIDKLLEAAGWTIQDVAEMNLEHH
jgi:type I site-specific restriction endonuclease